MTFHKRLKKRLNLSCQIPRGHLRQNTYINKSLSPNVLLILLISNNHVECDS